MLRLQETGKNSESEGDAYVYAAAQSIEAMLAQDTPGANAGHCPRQFSSQQSFNPICEIRHLRCAAQCLPPLVIQTEKSPAIERIGLISYATRPSDEMPTLKQDDRNTLLSHPELHRFGS